VLVSFVLLGFAAAPLVIPLYIICSFTDKLRSSLGGTVGKKGF
jgi:hypothetical protein